MILYADSNTKLNQFVQASNHVRQSILFILDISSKFVVCLAHLQTWLVLVSQALTPDMIWGTHKE